MTTSDVPLAVAICLLSTMGFAASNALQHRVAGTIPATVDHAIGVKGNGIQRAGSTVGKDGVSTVTANLKSGRYEFYCPVDGHESAGMKGTLTVR